MSLHATRRRRQASFRWAVVGVIGLFFALPIVAMVEFTTRAPGGGRTLDTWATLFNFSLIDADYPELKHGVLASAGLTLLTVTIMLVMLVPTMTWVRLRLPGLRRLVEFICLLPLTIPAIVLVVGLAPVYAWVAYFLGESSLWLALAYVILVLPYAYRALDAGLGAIDVKTLAESARSLGAGWPTVMWRIILPNVRTAVLSAAFLSVALVLGEFTIASLFSRDNLQVAINLLGKRDSSLAIAAALAALVLAFVVLVAMSFVGSGRSAAVVGRTAPRRTDVPHPHAGLRRTGRSRTRCGRDPDQPAPLLWTRSRPGWAHAGHRARRVRRTPRPLRLRQDHRPARVGRAGRCRLRAGRGRWQGHHLSTDQCP
jgi:putative spermidine/putrescine transport system permease protein